MQTGRLPAFYFEAALVIIKVAYSALDNESQFSAPCIPRILSGLDFDLGRLKGKRGERGLGFGCHGDL